MSRHFEEACIEPLYSCLKENEIPGYPNHYATEEGEIIRINKPKDIDEITTAHYVRKHKGDKQGHINVRIKGNAGEAKEPYIHRLVAKTHIPNPNNLPIVRHLDDNPSNNCIDNLAWGTQKDNHNDSVRNGTYKSIKNEDREKGLDKVRRPVYSEKDGKRREYKSIADAKRATGAKNANKVLSGEREHSCGYKFGYLDDK